MQIWQFLTLELVDADLSRWRSAQVRGGIVAEASSDRMKQVLQDARTGEVAVEDVPAPQLLPGCVLVRVAASLVSAGTERASAEFAKKNLLQKAQARPDLVREVLNKVQRDGLLSAIQRGTQPSRSAAASRLQQCGHRNCGRRRRYRHSGRRPRRLCRCRVRGARGNCLHSAPVDGAHPCRSIPASSQRQFLSTKLLSRRWAQSRCTEFVLPKYKLGDVVAVIGLGSARPTHGAVAESGWLSRSGNGH